MRIMDWSSDVCSSDLSLSDRGGIMTIVDKMTAAERLMQNAVDMIDRKDDPLAIHVVASSALSLLRELVGTRGDDYVAQLIKDALFRAAQSKIQGLPTGMPESATVDHTVEPVVLGIEEGGWKTAADVVIATPKQEDRARHDYILKKSEEQKSKLQSLISLSYAVFYLKKQKNKIDYA